MSDKGLLHRRIGLCCSHRRPALEMMIVRRTAGDKLPVINQSDAIAIFASSIKWLITVTPFPPHTINMQPKFTAGEDQPRR